MLSLNLFQRQLVVNVSKPEISVFYNLSGLSCCFIFINILFAIRRYVEKMCRFIIVFDNLVSSC